MCSGLLPLAVPSTEADSIYKWVDSAGRVTYSSTPPTDNRGSRVEQIEIQPAPTDSQTTDAQNRQIDTESALRDSGNRRSEQDAQKTKAVVQAQKELFAAEAALTQARIQGPDDWQHLAKGGKVLRPEYRARIVAAETRVEAAKQALVRAKGQ